MLSRNISEQLLMYYSTQNSEFVYLTIVDYSDCGGVVGWHYYEKVTSACQHGTLIKTMFKPFMKSQSLLDFVGIKYQQKKKKIFVTFLHFYLSNEYCKINLLYKYLSLQKCVEIMNHN